MIHFRQMSRESWPLLDINQYCQLQRWVPVPALFSLFIFDEAGQEEQIDKCWTEEKQERNSAEQKGDRAGGMHECMTGGLQDRKETGLSISLT